MSEKHSQGPTGQVPTVPDQGPPVPFSGAGVHAAAVRRLAELRPGDNEPLTQAQVVRILKNAGVTPLGLVGVAKIYAPAVVDLVVTEVMAIRARRSGA
jgi:hypothetical protein